MKRHTGKSLAAYLRGRPCRVAIDAPGMPALVRLHKGAALRMLDKFPDRSFWVDVRNPDSDAHRGPDTRLVIIVAYTVAK